MNTKHNEGSAANAIQAAKQHGFSHGDEYKLLREEIMQRIRDIHQTEIFGGIGIGIVYSWLILHKHDVTSPIIWFIGPCIVALCAISCIVNVFVMWRIGLYLARIEELVFAEDETVLGWEREQRRPGSERRIANVHFILSFSIWVLAFAATIWASWALSRP
jgi:hypothetical protein